MRGTRTQNPLPCTQGRGQGEGTASRDIARFASRSVRPLTPALSPEYRGEGEGTANFVSLRLHLHIRRLAPQIRMLAQVPLHPLGQRARRRGERKPQADIRVTLI